MIKTFTLILIALASYGWAQEVPKVEIGHNTSFSFFARNPNYVTIVKIPFETVTRYPGGTCAKFEFHNVNSKDFTPATGWQTYYTKLNGFNGLYSNTWYYIRSVTEDLTKDHKAIFVIPMLTHYKSQKAELYSKYHELNKITSIDILNKSSFSQDFKKTVMDAILMYRALVNNRVCVDMVEASNEVYLNHDSNLAEAIRIYNKDKADYRLDVFRNLTAMYVRLLKAEDSTLRFYFPMPEEPAGGHKVYFNYFSRKSVMDSMGIDGIAVHPYCKLNTVPTDTTKAFYAAWQQRLTFYDMERTQIVPKINGRTIIHSEYSNSENLPILRNTMADVLLNGQEMLLRSSIPQIEAAFYHALSNGTHTGTAIKMNGYSKAEGIKLNAMGLFYTLYQQYKRTPDFINHSATPIKLSSPRNISLLKSNSLGGFPVRQDLFTSELPAFSVGYYK